MSKNLVGSSKAISLRKQLPLIFNVLVGTRSCILKSSSHLKHVYFTPTWNRGNLCCPDWRNASLVFAKETICDEQKCSQNFYPQQFYPQLLTRCLSPIRLSLKERMHLCGIQFWLQFYPPFPHIPIEGSSQRELK